VPETGIEPVRPLFTKRRILSPMCLPISPLRHECLLSNKNAPTTEVDEAFVTRIIWRRGPESNRTNRICNPGHNRFATAPNFLIKTPNHGFQLIKKGSFFCFPFFGIGAGKESRTLDLNLGKVALYQLSYSRVSSPKLYRSFLPSLRSPLKLFASSHSLSIAP
jgi:hypothetical protein